MNNKLKLTLGALPVLLSMAVTSAHAGSLGKAANDTLEFTLREPNVAEITVTPEAGLLSGAALDANKKLATAVASLGTSKGTATDLGVKWVVTADGGVIDLGEPGKYSLVSTSDKSKKLKVMLATDASGTKAVPKTSDPSYVGTDKAVEIQDMTLYVVVDGAGQTPVPGTYSGVLQAAAYTQ
ncbi:MULTISPECIES: hypothetical protein [Lelliottia]|uniref:Uncharacterized protein n=1 Tax=Lelliottia aquatilis TaxID=2080838 RepID=A0ABX4ZXG0_9ENTR|nr:MULTISPECIES: hypothetical protein [Lelliottia]POZ16194.1 hypothetical protein C3Z09_12635 [Lelliottia aquatilis]POZ16221.1 hypothetical protein C3708_20070 [Lelliottia sp. 7254-16]POZ20535.1 hypothetical protein C3712_18135 [Lelliottia aquatilis]POZ22042.1 hypothetical protein C3711_18880 [Lelliottia aquatilis]POZ33112.1 hypothetical protein C3710_10210 [Lelliottia aquatilis]